MIQTIMHEGYTLIQACGWTGNAQQESYETLETKVEGDHGAAKGIFQWHGARYHELEAYAKRNGKSPDDFRTQVLFSLIEPGEEKAHKLLRSAKTLAEAVSAGIAYTRPGRPMLSRRLTLAEALYKAMQ